MACEVPEMSSAIHGGRPHSKPPLVTASLTGRVGVHAGLAVVDVDEDVVELVDVEEEVLLVVVESVDVIFGLQEQAEL